MDDASQADEQAEDAERVVWDIVGVSVPREMKRELRELARAEGKRLSPYAREVLQRHLEQVRQSAA